MGTSTLGGPVQQGTQTQPEDPSLPICSCSVVGDPKRAGPTQEAPKDLSGTYDSSDVPQEFTTPPPELPENID